MADIVMSLNVVNLVGRLGGNPNGRYFESGAVKCELSLAVKKIGSSKPDWFNLVLWGKIAEVAIDYTRKGSLIGVTGSLVIESYTNNEGHFVTKPVIRVNNLDLLGSKNDNRNFNNNYDDYDHESANPTEF